MKIKDIDKSKLVFVHEEDDVIVDELFESKEVGYYKDSWNRFKSNRASFTAFIIICIMMFFIIFGPYMKRYDLPQRSHTDALRFKYLPPKIPGLEKLGIFDGSKTITVGKRYLNLIANSEYGEGIILSGMPQELIDDVNHPDYANVSNLTVKVDYYKYTNFSQSYVPEDYFSKIDDPDALAGVIRTINSKTYEEYLRKGYILDVINIRSERVMKQAPAGILVDGTMYYEYEEIQYTYDVRFDAFMAGLQKTPDQTYFWFGTTSRGNDLFTEIWKGARISLIMAISVLTVNSTIGLILGAIAGYYGGLVDLIFDRFVEVISSIPFLPVLTLLTLRYGTATWVVVLAFTLTGWVSMYRTGRMQFYRFKNREYALAAKTLGASDRRIMFKHIFPNTLGLIITGMALSIPAFVFTEASYSFLGIIRYSNATSVGMLIQEGQVEMQNHPHLLLYPSLYIAILMIAFNLFGNGLRDAFNPSLRGAE